MGARYNSDEIERLVREAREALADLDDPDHAWFTANGSEAVDQLEAARDEARHWAAASDELARAANQNQREVDRLRAQLRGLEQQAAETTARLAASREHVDDLAGWCRYALDNWAPGGSGKAEHMERSLVGTIGERKP